MGVKTNYFRLGLFVVAAIAAAIASILILLGPSLGKPYAEMETYFQFSISGLEVGAPVKFRGIQVGDDGTCFWIKHDASVCDSKNTFQFVTDNDESCP